MTDIFQMAQELYSSGIIGVETFKELLGWPDLEKVMNQQTSQIRYLEKTIEKMLDSTEEDRFQAPDPFLTDKPTALMQTAQAYFEALYNDAPEHNLQLLRDYMTALNQAIMAAMMPPPGAAVPGAAGPASGFHEFHSAPVRLETCV